MYLAEASLSLNWAVLLPVVTGFLAVAYLLPTPKRRPWHHIVLGVVAAVLGFFTFLYHGPGTLLAFNAEFFLFFAFALEAFTFAVLMIVQRNPARAAIFFAVVVLSVCGLFLLLAAPFLMAATIIIYAGAIIVTFLFVIMLAQQSRPTDANDRSREPSLAAAVGFVLLGTLLVVLQRVYSTREADEVIARAERCANTAGLDETLKDPVRAKAFIDDVRRVRERLGYGRVVIPSHVNGIEVRLPDSDPVVDLETALGLNPPFFSMDGGSLPEPDPEEIKPIAAQIYFELSYLKAVREGRASPQPSGMALSRHGQARPANLDVDPTKAEPNRLPNANVSAIGRTLYTDHLLAVELGGTLLLVATIGAIAIAGGRREASA
jgi:NADH:ubiquinone oxidoreductase subunit 6 (subunit J)